MVKQAIAGVGAFVLAGLLTVGSFFVYQHFQLVSALIDVLQKQQAPAAQVGDVNQP